MLSPRAMTAVSATVTAMVMGTAVMVMMRATPAPTPAPVHSDINRYIHPAGFISGDIPFIHNGKTELFCFHITADFHFCQNICIAPCVAGYAQLTVLLIDGGDIFRKAGQCQIIGNIAGYPYQNPAFAF